MFRNCFCLTLLFVPVLLFGEFQNDFGGCQYEWCCAPFENRCTNFLGNPCSNFYVGFEGGWSNGLNRAKRATNVGETELVGTSNDAHAFFGKAMGAEIGWRLYSWIRTDISYTFLHNRYNWETLYPVLLLNHSYAYLDSHLVLWNGYLHFPGLCFMSWLNPYIGGGIGVAINRLHEIQEFASNGAFIADIAPKTQTNFGARIGVGALFNVTRCVLFDVAFNANYINKILSGNTRRLIAAGGFIVPINQFHFRNNWIWSATLGVKFIFPRI